MEQQTNLFNLESILNFSSKLSETYNRDLILNSALLSVMGKLKILRACVIVPSGLGKYSILLTKGKLPHINYPDGESCFDCSFEEAERIVLELGLIYFLPVVHQSETLAVLCFGKKADNSELTNEEEHYVNLISTITANALQNALNHSSLMLEKVKTEQRNQLLSTLFEMSRDFSTLLSREQILKMLSFHLMGQLMVGRFAVYLLREDNTFYSIFNRFTNEAEHNLICELSSLEKAVLLSNIECSGDTHSFLVSIGAELVSPMIVQGKIKGLLIIGKKLAGGQFTEENLLFIEALGNTSIAALENERLFKEEIDKKLLDSEIQLALEIQNNLLPKEMPSYENFEIAGATFPSRHVGGDYFDVIMQPNGKLFIAITDVSGKGMPAAIIMASVQAALRLVVPMQLSLTEVINRLNLLLYQNTTPDKFVTFFCCELDNQSRKLKYVNAGHNPPIYYNKSSGFTSLHKGGLILGFMEKTPNYEMGELQLDKDSVLLLYTDGVTEAMDKDENEFGVDRILSFLENNFKDDADTILQSLVTEVKNYYGGISQYDDITAVVIKSV